MSVARFRRAAEPLLRDEFLRYRVGSVAIVVVGTALSAWVFSAISTTEHDVVRLTFEQKAQSDVAALNLAMERGLESVESLGALFDTGHEISKAQFEAFGERALARNPAVKAVAWTPLVRGDERRAFERAAQKDEPGYRIKELNAQFKMVQADDRGEYFPIRYSVDRDGPGHSPYGMDRLSVANSRGGLVRSRASGEAAASGRIRITTGRFQGEFGVALSRPVYRRGAEVDTPEQRSRHLAGFTISVLVVRNLVDSILKQVGSEGIRVVLYDGSASEAERFLAVWPDAAQKDPALSEKREPEFRRSAAFKVGDREWIAVMTPQPGRFSTEPSWHAWAASGSGLALALLLAVYIESARRHARGMHDRSITDALTGLYNRRYLWELLKREVLRAERDATTLAAMMIDIDHFKRVNDAFGHEAGDLVLAQFGALLKRSVRGSDVACRYGGEEFAIVLTRISIEDAQRRAEAIRAAVKGLALEHRGTPLGPLSISMGIAVFPGHAGDMESLMRSADEALYAAKQTGRDRVVVATAGRRGAIAA
jgi:diguanylate cyclase (GGDEF)-like protein